MNILVKIGRNMKLREIIGELNTIYNSESAENWDNVGLLLGDENREIDKILFCLDLTMDVVKEAIEKNVNLIISHHPLIFSGIKKITNETILGNKILKLIENKISVCSMHTNVDFSVNGLNDFILKRIFGNENTKMCNEVKYEKYNNIKNEMESHIKGYARIKELKEEMTLREIINLIKEKLNIKFVRYVGDEEKKIKNIGLVTGSGISLMEDIKNDIDLFLTGDLKHHESLDVLENGKVLIDIGHYESEYLFVELMENEVKKFFSGEIIKFYDTPLFKLG